MGGLNWIVKSRLRFKSVCKFWRSLIQSTNTTKSSSSSSSSKFGNFLFHVSGPRGYLLESTILMLSPGSEYEFKSRSVSESSSGSGSGSGGWCWSTDTDGLCDKSMITAGKSDAWYTYFAPHKKSKSGKHDDSAEEKVFKVLSNQHEHEHEMVFKLDNLGIPSCYKFFVYPKHIVGSCNGLICLFDRQRMDISLWNPATRQFRILPKWLTNKPKWLTNKVGTAEERHYLVQLGYDVETKDHKVVVVIWSNPRQSFRPNPSPSSWFYLLPDQEWFCRIQIYSLSTDSWRILEHINYLRGVPINYHCQAYPSVYLNGSCFFMQYFYDFFDYQTNKLKTIMLFDFTKEDFASLPLLDLDEKQELFLSSLGEKLALFSVCHQSPIVYPLGLMVQDYDIWVFNNYKYQPMYKGFWKKLHSFQIITEGEYTVPIGISNDGEFALLELQGRDGLSKKIQLYNLVTKEVKKDFLYCSTMWSKAIAYEPSLVGVWRPLPTNQGGETKP